MSLSPGPGARKDQPTSNLEVWGLIHRPAEGSGWGVTIPDFPGCVAVGETEEEAARNADEALSGFLAIMRADGDEIPAPRSRQQLLRDPEVRDDAEGGAVWVLLRPRVVGAPRVRVNIMIDPGLLREADHAAEREGMTRSAYIEDALRLVLGKGVRAPLAVRNRMAAGKRPAERA